MQRIIRNKSRKKNEENGAAIELLAESTREFNDLVFHFFSSKVFSLLHTCLRFLSGKRRKCISIEASDAISAHASRGFTKKKRNVRSEKDSQPAFYIIILFSGWNREANSTIMTCKDFVFFNRQLTLEACRVFDKIVLKKTLLIIVQLICSMAFRATPLLMKSFDVTSTNATLCFRQHCRVKKESESSPLRQFQFYSSAETIKSWQIHRNHQRPDSIKRYFRNC